MSDDCMKSSNGGDKLDGAWSDLLLSHYALVNRYREVLRRARCGEIESSNTAKDKGRPLFASTILACVVLAIYSTPPFSAAGLLHTLRAIVLWVSSGALAVLLYRIAVKVQFRRLVSPQWLLTLLVEVHVSRRLQIIADEYRARLACQPSGNTHRELDYAAATLEQWTTRAWSLRKLMGLSLPPVIATTITWAMGRGWLASTGIQYTIIVVVAAYAVLATMYSFGDKRCLFSDGTDTVYALEKHHFGLIGRAKPCEWPFDLFYMAVFGALFIWTAVPPVPNPHVSNDWIPVGPIAQSLTVLALGGCMLMFAAVRFWRRIGSERW